MGDSTSAEAAKTIVDQREKLTKMAADVEARNKDRSKCQAASEGLRVELERVSKSNPEAIGQFLGLNLIRDESGQVARNEKGDAWGYGINFPLLRVEDAGLTKAIDRYVSHLSEKCTRR